MKNRPPARPSPFVDLPDHPLLDLAWPTPSHHLFDKPEPYFARTRVNPDYGRPGWTRDCGNRAHRGCDIAPIDFTLTGDTCRVLFTDCETGTEYPSDEPVLVPHDPLFCIFDGQVDEAIDDPMASDFGIHIVVRHLWPETQRVFYTLYAHLAELEVAENEWVPQGHRIGRMGTTSRIEDARDWMAIAPHLHFEVWNDQKRPYDPEMFLRTHLAH